MQFLVEEYLFNKKSNRIINGKKCIKCVINAFLTGLAITKYALLMPKKPEKPLHVVHWEHTEVKQKQKFY